MSNKKAAVMSGGTTAIEDNFYSHLFCNYDFLVAADMGMNVFFRLNKKPNVVIGDFDSISSNVDLAGIELHKFPQEKDKSDTELAIDLCISKNFYYIDIFGGIGSRLDHTLANAYLLTKNTYSEVNMRLINPWHEIQLLTPKRKISVVGEKGNIISLVPISSSIKDVTITGCRWNVKKECIQRGESRGLSNYLNKNVGTFSISEGSAFVFKILK